MTNKHGAFIWYELLTKDVTALDAFCSVVIGWTSTDSGQTDRNYRILMANGAGVGGMMQLTEAMMAHGVEPRPVRESSTGRLKGPAMIISSMRSTPQGAAFSLVGQRH